MRGMKSVDLIAIIDFLYYGAINVCQENVEFPHYRWRTKITEEEWILTLTPTNLPTWQIKSNLPLYHRGTQYIVFKTLTKNTSKLSEKKIFQALQSIQTLNGADGNVFCPKWTSYRYKCWAWVQELNNWTEWWRCLDHFINSLIGHSRIIFVQKTFDMSKP